MLYYNLKPKNIGWNKETFFWLLERDDSDEHAGKLIDYLMIACILINVSCTIFETVPSYNEKFHHQFEMVNTITVIIFTIEYILRIWCCVVNPEYQSPILGRLKYSKTPLALIDFFSILPFYLPLIIAMDIDFLRILRLFRLIRLIKLFRYSQSASVFRDVYRLKKSELKMVLGAIFFLLILASSLVYHFENKAQPEKFSSIPASMWWAMATLTTVGYGDVYPITTQGKLFASLIAIMGIGMVALPSGILGSGFVIIMRRKGGGSFKCPHCKQDIQRGKH
jgi:voltage-gated potassium channel